MDWKKTLDWAKRIGTALGAWLWLIKIIVGALGCAVLFVSVSGWRNANAAFATLSEEHETLKNEIVAQRSSASKLEAEKRDLFASSVELRERYAALEKEVGKLTVVASMNVSSPVAGAVAHGTPRPEGKPPAGTPPAIVQVPLKLDPPVLLREGDKGHIQTRALTVETRNGNQVLLLESLCHRDEPAPSTVIMRDVADVPMSEVYRLAPRPLPGVGIGPRIGLTDGQIVFGAVVSPAVFDFKLPFTETHANIELLVGAAANANGKFTATVDALGRLR